MLRLTPAHVFSDNASVKGPGFSVRLEFARMSEQGAVIANGTRFKVRKHGVTSGRWTLEAGGEVVATAQKSTPFHRTFRIEGTMGAQVLRAKSAVGRAMLVEADGRVVLRLAPNNAFTRKARVDLCGVEWDAASVGFVCWLTLLTWRRASSSAAAGS